MLLGHEAAGIVEQAGSAVADMPVGQRIVMTFLPRCGHCPACATNGLTPCEPGSAANGAGTLMAGERRLSRGGQPVNHHLGVSGFATYAVVDRRSVVPVPADVPPAVASLLGCAVLTGGGAVINAGRPQPGQTVVVVGLGGVGMAAVITALAHHDVTVIGVDQLADKLDLARSMGVHEAYTPDEARERGIKAAVVIEAVGHPLGAANRNRPHRTRRPDRHRRLAAAGRTNQCVAVGFRRRGPITDRQLSRLRRAFTGHPALRRACGGRADCRSKNLSRRRSRSTRSTAAWINWPTGTRSAS